MASTSFKAINPLNWCNRMKLDIKDAIQSHKDGLFFIHGFDEKDPLRVCVDANALVSSKNTHKNLTIVKKYISSKKQINQLIISNLPKCIATGNEDQIVKMAECKSFLSSIYQRYPTRIILDLSTSEPSLAEDIILKAMEEIVDNNTSFTSITPFILISSGTKWNSEASYSALKIASSTGNTIFANKRPEEGKYLRNEASAVTINLPQMSLISRDEPSFFDGLVQAITVIEDYMREKIRDNKYQIEMTASSICLLGGDEAMRNLLGKGIDTKQGKAVTYKVLEILRSQINELAEKTGNTYLLEPCPESSVSSILAEIDFNKFSEAQLSEKNLYYTQSTRLPSNYTDDLYDALEHQKKLQSYYDYGEFFPIYLNEPIDDPDVTGTLLKRIFNRFTSPAVALAPKFNLCSKHGIVATSPCPFCGNIVEEWGWGWNSLLPKKKMSVAEKEDWSKCRPYAVKSK